MDMEYLIKRYQSKLNSRLERLQTLKLAATSGGFADTNGLDSRIERMMDELSRLQKIKYGLRDTNIDQFIRNEMV